MTGTPGSDDSADGEEQVQTFSVYELPVDDPATAKGTYVEVNNEYGVIKTVLGGRALVDFNVEVPDNMKDDVRTRSVDEFPTKGDYVQVDGDYAIVTSVIGNRARVNFSVSRPGDIVWTTESSDQTDGSARENLDPSASENCSTEGIPTVGDYVQVDGEYGIVDNILGDRAQIKFDAVNLANEEEEIAEQTQNRSTTNETGSQVSHGIPREIPAPPSDISIAYDGVGEAEPIGEGRKAKVVRKVYETSAGSIPVAIKRPQLSGTIHVDQMEEWLEEAETWQKLDDHEHIVSVVDYGSAPVPWIAMEYMDGGHLGERVGQMDLQQALWTALTITKTVRYAHRRGVAHLDLKPANILFRTVEDAWDAPKVADWGLSKHLLEHTQGIKGLTPEYAAPEQFNEDSDSLDDITDIYQLGAVFYEVFTGQSPFEKDSTAVTRSSVSERPTPPSEQANVPDELDKILLTALSPERENRYEDIVFLRDELKELIDSVPSNTETSVHDGTTPSDDELRCPKCNSTFEKCSSRTGDICPECHRGYLTRSDI